MPTGFKCRVCNSCTEYTYVDNLIFIYCEFCKKYYHRIPGGEIRMIKDPQEFANEIKEKFSREPVSRDRIINNVVSPGGKIYSGITNIKGFCEEHKIDYKNFIHLIGGRRKTVEGWTMLKDEE